MRPTRFIPNTIIIIIYYYYNYDYYYYYDRTSQQYLAHVDPTRSETSKQTNNPSPLNWTKRPLLWLSSQSTLVSHICTCQTLTIPNHFHYYHYVSDNDDVNYDDLFYARERRRRPLASGLFSVPASGPGERSLTRPPAKSMMEGANAMDDDLEFRCFWLDSFWF